MKYITEPIY